MWTLVLVLAACSPDEEGSVREGPPGDDTGPDDTGEPPPVDGCRATPRDADRDRVVLVAHPYDVSAGQSDEWEVLELDQDGDLVGIHHTIELGRAPWGVMRFTPDGSIGIVALDDGTLGVVAIDEDNEVSVVHAGLSGDFYASAVAVHPSGEKAWIVDGNWANNGGGLYEAAIDCETGELGTPVRMVEAKLPAALLPTAHDGSEGVLVAREVEGGVDGEDATLLDLEAYSRLGGDDLFGDDEAIVAGTALAADGSWLLVGDNSEWSGLGNRVAVGTLGSDISAAQVLEDIEDPMAMVGSPSSGHVLVVSGYGDAFFVLEETGEDAAPFANAGELDYTGGAPQLPADAVMVGRGSLDGLVLVVENQGIRQVKLGVDGPEDLGLSSLGSGYAAIPGAIGLQP